MILQLLIGSIVITLSIFVEVLFIYIAVKNMKRLAGASLFSSQFLSMVFFLSGITLWLLLAFSLISWFWAFTLLSVGAFSSLEEAVYFAMVSFTSLGFGDIVLDQQWRILSAMVAANGLLIFGLNTAVIVETLRQILLAASTRRP